MAHQQRMEPQLVERAQTGDRRAQAELWRVHRRWVAAIILAHRPRTVEVEDLMQEVAIKLVTKLDTLREVGAFRPWLRRIIINICRGAAREQRSTLSLNQGDRSFDRADGERGGISPPESPEDAADVLPARREAVRKIMQQVLTLPAEYREPLLLRCVRSMTYEQISQTLDLPVTTIETRLARARRMLREEVGGIMADIRETGI